MRDEVSTAATAVVREDLVVPTFSGIFIQNRKPITGPRPGDSDEMDPFRFRLPLLDSQPDFYAARHGHHEESQLCDSPV
jgi:hypothetical protein